MTITSRLAAAAVISLSAATASAECPAPEAMYAAAEGWLGGGRVPDPGLSSLEDGACAYTAFRDWLEDDLGAPVGVKVGFTSAPAQERFGVPGPVAGALFAPMLVNDGAEISLTGARSPFYEADLIVTVGDAAIMEARTREEAAAALAEIRPFIELPDLAFADGVAPSGPLFAAYGVLPWRGVMGEGISITDLADPVADLGALQATLTANGKVADEATGAALLGHPLDVVLWLVGQGGYNLAPGSVISLGSLGQLHPAGPGDEVEASYRIGAHELRVGATLTE